MALNITNCRIVVLLGFLFAVSPASAFEALYKVDSGPDEIKISDSLFLNDAAQSRDIRFRVVSPITEGLYPVVIHSHGGFCLPENYDAFMTHWASHGYIVVAPNHPDSPNNDKRLSPDEMALLPAQRLQDLSFAVDELHQILKLAEINAEPNMNSIAVTGHSFGAGMALMKNGMFIADEYREDWSRGYDDRFSAAIYFSPPGGEPGVENAFATLKKPFLATGGTLDKGRLDPGEMSLADFRRQAFLLAPPGDKYSLILERADHYLGGLICNPERGGAADPEAVKIFNAYTTAFLDAYLKQDQLAKEYLLTSDAKVLTNGRADYRQR